MQLDEALHSKLSYTHRHAYIHTYTSTVMNCVQLLTIHPLSHIIQQT